MKHYGDISKINGATVEPVNVIIGGSPCQDLSVAGKQKGMKHTDNGDTETTRSGLFMEQLRIIKEMRRKDIEHGRTGIHTRPRFMVWENVPGAFSSNKGADFQAVLEETIKVIYEKAPVIPIPKQGWPNAGCITGMDGEWSIAWRVFDAQFWGVPQRRKRIALVADFGGLTAPEILFERESLHRNTEPSRQAGESATTEAERRLRAAVGAFCIQGNAIDRADTAGCNGKGWTEGVSYTLNTIDRPAVAVVPIDLRNATRNSASGDNCGVGIGEAGDPAFTITTDYSHAIALEQQPHVSHVVFDGESVTSKINASNPQIGDACHTLGASGASRTLLVSEPEQPCIVFEPGASSRTDGHIWQNGVAPTLRANSGDNHPAILLENHPADSRVKVSEDGVVQTLSARMGTGGGNVPLVMEAVVAAFMGGQGADAGSIAYSENVTPTIRADAGGNSIPMVMTKQVIREADVMGFDMYNQASTGGIARTLKTPIGGDDIPVIVTKQTPPIISATCGSFTQTNEGVSCTLLARDYKDPQIVCYPQNKRPTIKCQVENEEKN